MQFQYFSLLAGDFGCRRHQAHLLLLSFRKQQQSFCLEKVPARVNFSLVLKDSLIVFQMALVREVTDVPQPVLSIFEAMSVFVIIPSAVSQQVLTHEHFLLKLEGGKMNFLSVCWHQKLRCFK